MSRSGWSRLGHLLLVAVACLAILGAVKLVGRAVHRAVDDGNDRVTSDAERRAETLGSVLTNASRVLVVAFFSGFFLLMENQFGVGDIVNVDDKHIGTVERMTLRITQLRDAEGRAHFVPNGFIIRTLTKTAPGAQWEVARELRRRILLAFREAVIEIPFPQRVLHHRGSEPLAGTPASEA